MADKAILYDSSKCTACRGCQSACKQWNDLGAEITTFRGTYENPPDLSPSAWVKIQFKEVSNGNRRVDWLFNRRACLHCTDAACVTVCPTKALYHHPLGFVALDRGLCIGCGYCVEFCPFKVPRLDGNAISGFQKAFKCHFCQDRAPNGYEPACVKTCPPRALEYGDRDKLLAKAKERVKFLQGNGWPTTNLYGENILQGLHVVYVLQYEPEIYGLPKNPQVPATLASLWQGILQPLGYVAVGATAAGLLLNYLVARANIKGEKEE